MEDVITINVSITSWAIFWTVYWIAGTLFFTIGEQVKKVVDREENTNREENRSVGEEGKEKNDVISTLFANMFWSFVGVIGVSYIPFRGLVGYPDPVKLLINYFMAEVLFYHIHLLMHHPQIYSRVHKKHHKFVNDIYALAALYCTGYEMIFLNVFSTALGCVIMQISPVWVWIWFALVAFNSLASHSKDGVFSDRTHLIHHQKFKFNYGFLGLMDRLYGTRLEN